MAEASDSERELEQAFRRAMDELLPARLRTAALTVFAANSAFVLIDAFALSGDLLLLRTAVRVLFAPLFLAVGALARRQAGMRRPQQLVLLLAALQALLLALGGALLSPAENVGFFPAILFFCVFLPLPRRRSIEMASIFVGAFLGISALSRLWPLGLVAKHAGNLIAAGVVSVIAAGFAESWARGEYRARRALAEANQSLEAMRAAKDRFFTDVSHELRTPLTAALLALDAPKSTASEEPHAATRPLRRLQKLVDELLLLARIDGGAARATAELTDVSATLRKLAAEFSSGFTGKQLRLETRIEGRPLYARIGAGALERIASNLIGNALKYTPSGGRVMVRVLEENGAVVLEVEDDGPGIPREDLQRIFDRFVRVESRAAAPGIGVGLALAKELAELHGGGISCASELEKGTRFRAWWPLQRSPSNPGTRAPPSANPGGEGASRAQEAVAAALDGTQSVEAAPSQAAPDAPLILIIEDHRELAGRIAQALGPAVRTELSHDGAEGLEKARETRPALIVCDVLLPSMNGHQICRALRASPETAPIPVLLLSALAEREQVLEGLRAGADETMAKPFDAGMLRARVEALLRMRRRREPQAGGTEALEAFCRGMAQALRCDGALLLGERAGAIERLASSSRVDESAGWGLASADWFTVKDSRVLPAAETPKPLAIFSAIAIAPIDGEPRGALIFTSQSPREFSSADLELARSAAVGASALLARERSFGLLERLAEEKQRLASASLNGQDQERRRLALELHDGLGQTLVAALLHLDVILRATPGEGLSQARSLVGQALSDLRALTRELHPPVLQQHGLLKTLQWLVAQVDSRELRVELELPEALPALSSDAALALFRVAQSALANSVRHARARKSTLRLLRQPGLLVLELEDDGVGFELSRTESGVGLAGMRERMATHGGKLEVESELGRGTRVRASLPIAFEG